MKPRDLPSRWKKILPWYYTREAQPPRKPARKKAIEQSKKENE